MSRRGDKRSPSRVKREMHAMQSRYELRLEDAGRQLTSEIRRVRSEYERYVFERDDRTFWPTEPPRQPILKVMGETRRDFVDFEKPAPFIGQSVNVFVIRAVQMRLPLPDGTQVAWVAWERIQ